MFFLVWAFWAFFLILTKWKWFSLWSWRELFAKLLKGINNGSLQVMTSRFCGPEGRSNFADNMTEALLTSAIYARDKLQSFAKDASKSLHEVSAEISSGHCESMHYDGNVEDSERDVSRAQKALDDFVAKLAAAAERLNRSVTIIPPGGHPFLKEPWDRLGQQILFFRQFVKESVGGSLANFASLLKQLGATSANATVTQQLANATTEIMRQCSAVSRLRELLQDSFSTAAYQLRVAAVVDEQEHEALNGVLVLIRKSDQQQEEATRRICATLMPK